MFTHPIFGDFRTRIRVAWACIVFMVGPAAMAQPANAQREDVRFLDPYRQAAAKWEPQILEIEKRNSTGVFPNDAVLYIGSSSIRLWKGIDKDMAPWPAIQNGYGGAKFCDLAIYAPRIVKGLQYRAVVIFVGNDITGKETDKTPEQIVQLFQHVVKATREEHPQVPVFLVAVTPTPSRFQVWNEIRKANAALEKACQTMSACHFIRTEHAYLDEQGQPKSEYFLKDQLHQNESGYQVWSALIKRELEQVLKPISR